MGQATAAHPATKCIWCTQPTSPFEPEEHIVGEGLVGEQLFQVQHADGGVRELALVLRDGQVCGACNHCNGRLDEYLQKQFGFLNVYWNPIGTKSGKPASAQMPGMYAQRRDGGIHVSVSNSDQPIVNLQGKRIGPPRQKPNAVQVESFGLEGDIARIQLTQPFRINKRLSRALHKIAFELLCLQEGAAFVLDPYFVPIREYVLHGRGSRRIVFGTKGPVGSWEKPSFRLTNLTGRRDWYAELRLGLSFYVDLSPESVLLGRFDPVVGKEEGLVAWDDVKGILPTDKTD